MPSQMDPNELEVKKLLVDLEDEQERLQVSVEQLQKEVEKREIEIKNLLAERELARLSRENNDNNNDNNYQPQPKLMKSQSADFNRVQQASTGGDTAEPKYSSEFVRQVDLILERVTRTSEELSTLIKL